jgi:hypothetical protein
VKYYVVALLVAVAVLGGFYGGYKVGQNNVSANTTGATASRTPGGGFGGGGFGGGGRGGGGAAAACPSPGAPSPSPGTNAVARGTITDLTSNSFTIAFTACDVKITFAPSVQISKTAPGSTSDLKDNITITVIGTRQADGSIKATTIQIGGAVFGNPGGGAQASPSGG